MKQKPKPAPKIKPPPEYDEGPDAGERFEKSLKKILKVKKADLLKPVPKLA